MANRFARRIRSGEIESIGALKSEFKELAKRTHPDLRADEGTEEEFVAVRVEYEAALRDFERHRFGARGRERSRGDAQSVGAYAKPAVGGAGPLPDSVWACLELLFKRGFPKRPRHEKEALRYEYARWRLEQELGSGRAELFRAFESGLLDMKAFGSPAFDPILRLLRDFLEYRYAGLPAMRTHVVLSLGRLKASLGADWAVDAFLSELAMALGVGGEIGLTGLTGLSNAPGGGD